MFIQFKKYPLNIREEGGRKEVFDIVRKKYIALTPEEWIRQHWLWYFAEDKRYPKPLLAVEHAIEVLGQSRRTDVTVFNRSGKPALILECKSFDVPLSQETFDQAARYNLELRVPYIIISNGIQSYGCHVDLGAGKFIMLDRVPDFHELDETRPAAGTSA